MGCRSHCSHYRISGCTAPTIASLVESILKLYQRANFQVTEVCANHIFKPVLHILQYSRWSFMTNLANAQELVPEAEHNNCILKEHICTTYHGIPYKMLPRTAICYMVMETTGKLNYFPAKGGCSNYFSPREILHHVKLNYKKHCSMPLLSYTPTHDEQTLTNTAAVFSYVLFTQSKVDMSVIIFPLARSLHDLMSLSFLQPLL